MLQKASWILFLLLSAPFFGLQAQQPTLIPRLGITGMLQPLYVRDVWKNTPAQKAGVLEGDLLVAWDGQPLKSALDMHRAELSGAGPHVVTVVRRGQRMEIPLMMGPPPLASGIIPIGGVRVESVQRGSPASGVGLRNGDLITSITTGGNMHLMTTPAQLGDLIAAMPPSLRFGMTYLRGPKVEQPTLALDSPATGDPAVFAHANEASDQPGGGTGRGGGSAGSQSAVQAVQDARMSRFNSRMRGGGDGGSGRVAQPNTTLDQLLVNSSYTPSKALAQRMEEMNVLKFAFIDRNTGEVVFVGSYDPTYATGPIPYKALLADALQNPYPRFTLEYPGSGPNSPLGRVRATLDQEFAHIAQDPSYGVEWLGRLILPVLKGESQDPEQKAALNARLQAAGISPISYQAFMRWQASDFHDKGAYSQPANEFLPSLFRAAGLNPKPAAEIMAYHVYNLEQTRESLDEWCQMAGLTELEQRLDQEARTSSNNDVQVAQLVTALYSSILRGLGMPEGQISQIASVYMRSNGNEKLFLDQINQLYQPMFQKALIDIVVNGMSFTGATLSAQYGFPAIESALNTYGSKGDSPVMDVFFRADYILKFMTSSARPGESIPSHQTSQQFLGNAENSEGGAAGRTPNSGVIRYWLYPQSVEMDALNGNTGVRFRHASVKVGVETLEAEGGDSAGTAFYRNALQQYSALLTANYEQYARLYPMLHTLRETEKVVALARWARKNGLNIRVQADDAPKVQLPEQAQGFWGMTYIVRPNGSTDTMVTWAQGGVDFGPQTGDGWMQTGPPDQQVTDDALRSLAASTALSERAAAAAEGGDLDSARMLAERGAEAMSGNIDLTGVPAVPIPSTPEPPDPAVAAEVSQASVEAVDRNVQGLQQANANLAQASTLQQTAPERATQILQQNQELKAHSEENLNRLQTMLQQYRNSPGSGPEVVIDLRGLDPNKPTTVAILRPAAPQPLPVVRVQPAQPTLAASAPCPQGLERALPPRRQILAELETRRTQLDRLKSIMLRLNKSIQLDQKQYDEWGKQAQKGYDDLVESVQDLATDTAFDSATDMLGWRLQRDEEAAMKIENEAERMAKLKYINDQASKLEMADHLKTFYDYEKWALSNKDDWEMIDGGVRQLITFLPLAEEPMYAIKSAELLIDNLYEVANWRATWQNLSQLDHNTDQYLQIVKKNGEQMRKVVERIQELETQLKQTQDLPRSGSACTAGTGGGSR